MLGLGPVDEDELYTALDWLDERQPVVEASLTLRRLKDGVLVLYDVPSSYVEGRCCALALADKPILLSALNVTTYFLTVIAFVPTSHLHRCLVTT